MKEINEKEKVYSSNYNKLYEKLNGLIALEIFDYGDTQKNLEQEFSAEFSYLHNMQIDMFSNENEDTQFNILRIYDVYYRNGKPIINDKKYDTLNKIFESLFGTTLNPIMFEPSIDAWNKVEHIMPMGSLSKQTTIDEIEKWNTKKPIAGNNILISEKLDGISVSMIYEKGKFVRAVTRGNGKIGDDITQNAQYFDGVIKKLHEQWDCAIRGELIITKENLVNINNILINNGKEPLKNTRNGVSGQATKYKDRDEEILSLITFMAYDLYIFDMHDTNENVV